MPPKKTADAADELFQLKTSELLWMRDKFISGLSNLESGVHELRRAYISHFNTLLPESHPGRLSLPFFTSFDNNAAGPLGARADTPAGALNAEANVKKKRKPHDPNAPKRALTSYFLFMQHNKPQIKEAHPDWDAKEVAVESERRWNNISEADKQKYEYMYQVDLARYYKQKEAYEAGLPVPVINAEEATRLYNEHLKSGQPFKGRKGPEAAAAAPEPPAKKQRTSKKDDGSKPTPAKATPAAKAKGTPAATPKVAETASPAKKDVKKPAKGKRKSAAD